MRNLQTSENILTFSAVRLTTCSGDRSKERCALQTDRSGKRRSISTDGWAGNLCTAVTESTQGPYQLVKAAKRWLCYAGHIHGASHLQGLNHLQDNVLLFPVYQTDHITMIPSGSIALYAIEEHHNHVRESAIWSKIQKAHCSGDGFIERRFNLPLVSCLILLPDLICRVVVLIINASFPADPCTYTCVASPGDAHV